LVGHNQVVALLLAPKDLDVRRGTCAAPDPALMVPVEQIIRGANDLQHNCLDLVDLLGARHAWRHHLLLNAKGNTGNNLTTYLSLSLDAAGIQLAADGD
jgi:hypothetical protein